MTHVLSLDPDELAPAAAWEQSIRAGGAPVAEGAPFARWLAGATLARALERAHPQLAVSWHAGGEEWPGLLDIREPEVDANRHVLVLGEPASMDPRPVWPVRVPMQDLDAWLFDAVVWCYVPKRAALENNEAVAFARGVRPAGWAWADQVRTWERVALEPHEGHPHAAEVWQGRVKALQPEDTLVQALFAS